ncbi:autotransporter domain-containing protein, partial [Acidithiobacillus thiooxidans]|uniref:autotransporter outer membrane beta-barrel domain-containing protein n=1 Tax=Acidithiobacillus thiooxidans TaxID=930 RepID=UPI001C07390F
GTGSIADSSEVTNDGTFNLSGVTTTGGANITSLAGTGTTKLGSNNLTLTDASGTDSGTITGTGGLVLSQGTETLSGTNTYSGGTAINGGTLDLAGTGSIADSSEVTNDGTFNLSGVTTTGGANITSLAGTGTTKLGSNNLTLTDASGTDSGTITGTGGLVLSQGTETLSGTNNYSGGTAINGGILSVGNDDNLGASTGSLSFNGGTLLTTAGITDSRDITLDSGGGTLNNDGHADALSGTISGVGRMTFSGTGTTTLSGVNNTYSGGTLVDGGVTLNIDAGNNVGSGAVTLNGGTLASNASASSIALTNDMTIGSDGATLIGTSQTSLDPTTSNALTLTGDMSGSGALQTAGTLIDNGTGGTTGGTTVTGGLLEVGDSSHSTASLSGPVTVDSGAFLRGHGTIIGNTTNNGTVFPGGTIGILTVNGNYVQNPGSTLRIEVTPNDQTPGVGYDQLNVTGKAALAGNLAVQVDPGSYTVGEQYNIVHAGQGVSGAFSNVAYAPLFASYITPTVTYGAQGVYLNLTANPIAFNSGKAVPDNAYIVNQGLLGAMTRVFSAHKGVWAQGIGGFGRANGAHVANYGGVMGDGAAITSHLTLGAAFSGLGSETSTSYQQVDGRSFGFYGYGIYTQGHLRVSGALGTGYLSLNEQRELRPTPAIANGSSSGWFFATGAQARYLIPLSNTAFLMPYGEMSYLHTGTNAFTEQGAGNLDIAYAGQSTDLGIFTGGLRAGTNLRAGHLTWTPWVEVGGTGYAGNRRMNTIESIGTNINLVSSRVAPADGLDTGAGVTLKGHGPWTAKVAYVGQFAGDTHFNTFDLTASYRW